MDTIPANAYSNDTPVMDLIQSISITLQRRYGHKTKSLARSRNRLSHWAVGTEPHTTNMGIDPQWPKSITAYLSKLVKRKSLERTLSQMQ